MTYLILLVLLFIALIGAFLGGVVLGSDRQWLKQDTYWENEAYRVLGENQRLRQENGALSLRLSTLERKRHERSA